MTFRNNITLRVAQTCCIFIIVYLFSSSPLYAQATTQTVFNQYKDRLLQIRIIDKSTDAKSIIGSGFFVNANGGIITNYHVIERLIFRPEQYRVEYVSSTGQAIPARLIDFDVIHDLALLGSDSHNPYLKIQQQNPTKGQRIYSLGNPHDLGMTIVEGTYNGFTDDSMHQRILLTSSINPGMSGGPSITNQGKIIGVNVATAGNQIGFLVPAKYVKQLLTPANNTATKTDFIAKLTQQLYANQQQYMNKITNAPFKTKKVAKFLVPDKLSSYLTCWGDTSEDTDEDPYQTSSSSCSTKNKIYISTGFETGRISYSHHYLLAKEMNAFQFHALQQEFYSSPEFTLSGRKENITEFRCNTDFVKNNSIIFKTALCLRRYKKLHGLYDLILHAITLGDNTSSLQTTLTLSGVNYENAIKFAHRYLEAFTWVKP